MGKYNIAKSTGLLQKKNEFIETLQIETVFLKVDILGLQVDYDNLSVDLESLNNRQKEAQQAIKTKDQKIQLLEKENAIKEIKIVLLEKEAENLTAENKELQDNCNRDIENTLILQKQKLNEKHKQILHKYSEDLKDISQVLTKTDTEINLMN